jgi:iron complex outermembrane receptor protein
MGDQYMNATPYLDGPGKDTNATRIRRSVTCALFLGTSISTILACAAPARAQDGPAPIAEMPADQVGDIVVTARKRSENLLSTPVTLTALSAAAIQARGITDLAGVADFTPGMKFSNVGTGRADRSNQSIIIRGMTPNFNGNVSIFIDGAPVVGYGFIEGVDDVARVEVLKGPQSATFGRSTFAGAVNLVTKDPSNDFHASIDTQVTNYSGYDVRGSVEGPIISDKLTFRIQARDYKTDGSYKNSADPSETIGAQATRSIGLTLKATPTEHLSIKLFGDYWEDSDGSGPTYKISSPDYNCAAGAAGATLNYTCGALPKFKKSQLGANDDVDAAVRNQLLHNASGTFVYMPGFSGTFTNHFGLQRRAYHIHGIVDYDIPAIDATFTSITSYDRDRYEPLQDIDAEDTTGSPNPLYTPDQQGKLQSYINWPLFVQFSQKGYSQEARLQGGTHSPFHWSLGTSYFYQDAGYGTGALLNSGPVSFQTPTTIATKTIGGFFSAGYDLTDTLTVSFDGRYQNERQTLYNLVSGRIKEASESFNSFLPRALVQYKPVAGLMLYASYSKGVNPGGFNSNLVSFTPEQSAAIKSKYGIELDVKPEKITNYEIGIKTKFLDNKAELTAAVYHADWVNQVVENDVTITGVAGIPAGDQVQINQNVGKTALNGFELEGSFIPTAGLTLNGGFAYTPSKIKKYNCTVCAINVTGSTDVKGNRLSGTPSINLNVGAEYRHSLSAEVEGYARIDYIHANRIYEDVTNLAWIRPSNKVNIRFGATHGKLGLEAYVMNLFNDLTYTSVQRNEDLVRGFTNDAVVGLPVRRTLGLRLRESF